MRSSRCGFLRLFSGFAEASSVTLRVVFVLLVAVFVVTDAQAAPEFDVSQCAVTTPNVVPGSNGEGNPDFTKVKGSGLFGALRDHKYLDKNKRGVVAQSQITKKLQRVEARFRDAALRTLVESDDIKRVALTNDKTTWYQPLRTE